MCAAAICHSDTLGFSGLLTPGPESSNRGEGGRVGGGISVDLALLQGVHQKSVDRAALMHSVTPKKVENGFTRPVGGHSGW